MNTKKFIIRETALLLCGELLGAAAVVGIFALLGQMNYTVVLGAVIGALLATGNFLFMAIASDAAADKAAQQDVKGGKAAIKTSFYLRMVVIAALLVVFAKSGHCNVIAMVVPLFFAFPILMVIEFFRKSGGAKS